MKLKASLYPVKQQVLQSHIDKKLLFLHPILNFSVSALIQSILFIVIEAIETLKVGKKDIESKWQFVLTLANIQFSATFIIALSILKTVKP